MRRTHICRLRWLYWASRNAPRARVARCGRSDGKLIESIRILIAATASLPAKLLARSPHLGPGSLSLSSPFSVHLALRIALTQTISASSVAQRTHSGTVSALRTLWLLRAVQPTRLDDRSPGPPLRRDTTAHGSERAFASRTASRLHRWSRRLRAAVSAPLLVVD